MASRSAADIPDDFKTPLALIYRALHKRGVSRAVFLESMAEADFSVSGSQLDRWVARLDTTGSVIKEEKQTGAEPSLQRWERDVTSGWVLHENEHGNEVTLEAFHDFVLGKFSIELSNATISKYLSEDGFACRLGKKKGKGFTIDIESLRAMLWKWVLIQDFRDRKIKREKFASIDFTFTGHRNERRTTFAPKGGAQPMLKDRGSNFTNCIVTCLWSDGENRTPSMLFTYNSAFRRDRPQTLKRTKKVQHLLECLDKYGISEDRIVYIGNDKNETRKYARECPDLVRRFFSHYKVPLDTTIFSDEGNSFFEDGNSVLRAVGFKNHITYPAPVHQYLSPNDNPLHGSSKQKWRHNKVADADDVASCLALLSYLDEDTIKHSRKWWDQNMITLTEEGVKELIGQGAPKLSHLHKSWKRSYEDFMNQNNE